MGGFLEFIAENIIIFVIIIGAIVSFLRSRSVSGSGEAQDGQSNESVQDRPTIPGNNPNSSRQSTRAERQMEQQKTESIEEQQQEQMDRIARRMGATPASASEELEDGHKANIQANLRSGKNGGTSYQEQEFKREIKSRLNKKGLVDSIVMAEVLGPPRAKKPYSNVIMSHRK